MDKKLGIVAGNLNTTLKDHDIKPLELTNYLLLLTKERMVMETTLRENSLVENKKRLKIP